MASKLLACLSVVLLITSVIVILAPESVLDLGLLQIGLATIIGTITVVKVVTSRPFTLRNPPLSELFLYGPVDQRLSSSALVVLATTLIGLWATGNFPDGALFDQDGAYWINNHGSITQLSKEQWLRGRATMYTFLSTLLAFLVVFVSSFVETEKRQAA